ncbi:magnesium chelatase ATPase subunit I [Lichenicoccus roseus]|uniref:Mg-protoporphyrin IX chelatase n=1 Tax=Lichenicoccus roseus TaxID=2683649 RepID=A0A5R9JEJ5_9PROT|nr:magnesium chelatase ATPase subunit I [Lichenicoccus roseus]TLU74061.1 magnesium chelatase ATPase subunit I [Lichenicoccus roseus]
MNVALLGKPLPVTRRRRATAVRRVFPFTAMVGQRDMTQALLLAAVDPRIGGVLVLGDRGTGKSTAIRALAALLPTIRVIADCPYNCDPAAISPNCPHCNAPGATASPRTRSITVPAIDLPLGATEDRVVGSLDLERALADGSKHFEPGLLARAHRGFLYIDEVNLLEDHLVDLLLDVAASGENLVEREGLSIRHPARFVLVGSGNPEEGDLRPQLLDRFGLAVEVTTTTDLQERIEVLRRREAFEADPEGFTQAWSEPETALRRQIEEARALMRRVVTPDSLLQTVARLCLALGTDGLRGELSLLRAARALACLEGEHVVLPRHMRAIAVPALRHRLRRNPLDEGSATPRVERALAELAEA